MPIATKPPIRITIGSRNVNKLTELQACWQLFQQAAKQQASSQQPKGAALKQESSTSLNSCLNSGLNAGSSLSIELILPGMYPGISKNSQDQEIEEVEETGWDFITNARQKATGFLQQMARHPEWPQTDWVLAEDTGIVIPALAGRYGLDPFPGVHTKRWLTPERRQAILFPDSPSETPQDTQTVSRATTDLITQDDRNRCLWLLLQRSGHPQAWEAAYQCGMVLIAANSSLTIEAVGHMPLQVMSEWAPRGSGGFGYDPIMLTRNIPNIPEDRTVAELSANEKNAVSHRSQAFHQILSRLATHLA